MFNHIYSSALRLGALLATSASAFAAVSFEVQIERLQSTPGVDAPATTSFFLVADTDGDGFGPIVAGTLGSTLGDFTAEAYFFDGVGGDDLILWRGDLVTNGAGLISSILNGLSHGVYGGKDWGLGDTLALVWFPTLSQADTEIQAGLSYGLYTDPAGSPVYGDPWTTPADGTLNHRLYAFTDSANTLIAGPGALNDALLVADLSVIPEASHVAVFLALAAGVAVLIRRRR